MTLPLALSLDHVAQLLGRARAGSLARPLGLPAQGDPFFLDLPAIGDAGGTVTAPAVETMASLYFAAEVEGTYLAPVAEELAQNRFGLNLTDRAAAEALEQLARAMRGDWVGRPLRNQIFARTFGIGEADPNLGDTAVNREFEPRFARFAAALSASARDLSGWGAPAGAAMRAAVAGQALLGNLGNRMQGNTLIVTERLAAQLRLCITALNHPGMTALFMGRTAWDVVRGVLGDQTPDLAAHVTRAQTGLRMLSWLSQNLGPVRAADAQGIVDAIRGEAGLQGWAELWLDAAGIAPPAGQGRRLQ